MFDTQNVESVQTDLESVEEVAVCSALASAGSSNEA